MYDLHTHILPFMDDGAGSLEESVVMLEMEMAQGVEAVALTPHFYRNKEHIEDFLKRRAVAFNELCAHLEGRTHPRLILGAEVAWVSGMADMDMLPELCYEGTTLLLVELPFFPWNDEMFRQLYNLETRCGITPVIAHVERYFDFQEKRHINSLLEMELPIQISAAAFDRFFGRNRLMKFLLEKNALLISDCHNITARPPNIGEAIKKIEKRLGLEAVRKIVAETEYLISE